MKTLELLFVSVFAIAIFAVFIFMSFTSQIFGSTETSAQQQYGPTPFDYRTFNVEGVQVSIKIPPSWAEIEPQHKSHFANFVTNAVNEDGIAIGDMRLGVDVNPGTSDLNQYMQNEINTYMNNPAFENYEITVQNVANEPGAAPSFELWSTHTERHRN